MAHKERIESLEGLRALAVCCVLFQHLNGAYVHKWAMANLGVAVFFGISGFLAYFMLSKDESRSQSIDYHYYLKKRALRIWPLYFAVIAFIFWMDVDHSLNNESWLVYVVSPLITFSLDLDLANHGAQLPTELSPLWSIGTEEKFYLVAPLLFFAIRSKYRGYFIGMVFAASNLWRFYYAHSVGASAMSLYYLPYTYIDTFVSGAFAAQLYLSNDSAPWRIIITKISRSPLMALFVLLALVFVARIWGLYLATSHNLLWPIPYIFIPPTIFLFLYCAVVDHGSILYRVLSLSVLRILGVLSYAMYVIHLLVFKWLDAILWRPTPTDASRGIAYNVIAFSLVIVTAAVLHFGIERPFLRLKDRVAPSASSELDINNLPWATVISVALVLSGFAMAAIRIN